MLVQIGLRRLARNARRLSVGTRVDLPILIVSISPAAIISYRVDLPIPSICAARGIRTANGSTAWAIPSEFIFLTSSVLRSRVENRARSGHACPSRKQVCTEAATQMLGNGVRIATLPPKSWTVVFADRFPVVAGRVKARKEYPSCSIDIETGIVREPPPNYLGRATCHRSDFAYPPTIDLKRSKVVTAVAVLDLGPDPSTFLITQAPKRPFKPLTAAGGGANALGNPCFSISAFRSGKRGTSWRQGSRGDHDRYPVKAVSGHDGFLHSHGREMAAEPATYRMTRAAKTGLRRGSSGRTCPSSRLPTTRGLQNKSGSQGALFARVERGRPSSAPHGHGAARHAAYRDDLHAAQSGFAHCRGGDVPSLQAPTSSHRTAVRAGRRAVSHPQSRALHRTAPA